MAKRLSQPPSSRDQTPTAFAEILERLCRKTGAECAALVDDEGETVDYHGLGDPFLIRVLAAELGIVLRGVERSRFGGAASQLFVRGQKKSFVITSLPAGYALVLRLPRRAASISERALSEACAALCSEAGFDPDDSSERGTKGKGRWRGVSVREASHTTRRPLAVCVPTGEVGLEVLGLLRLSAGELGFRVRLATGEEGTLVRERLGHWYLEEDI